MKRILIAVLALAVMAAGATVATAKRGKHHGGKGAAERVFTLSPDPNTAPGNPEGIAFDRRSTAFFVRSPPTVTSIAGRWTATPSRRSSRARVPVGIKVMRGKLYVAGGRAGDQGLRPRHQGLVATFDTKTAPSENGSSTTSW